MTNDIEDQWPRRPGQSEPGQRAFECGAARNTYPFDEHVVHQERFQIQLHTRSPAVLPEQITEVDEHGHCGRVG